MPGLLGMPFHQYVPPSPDLLRWYYGCVLLAKGEPGVCLAGRLLPVFGNTPVFAGARCAYRHWRALLPQDFPRLFFPVQEVPAVQDQSAFLAVESRRQVKGE